MYVWGMNTHGVVMIWVWHNVHLEGTWHDDIAICVQLLLIFLITKV